MAPVSHPDKDVDAPDGGEGCFIMALGGGFDVFSLNVAKKKANSLVSILEN